MICKLSKSLAIDLVTICDENADTRRIRVTGRKRARDDNFKVTVVTI